MTRQVAVLLANHWQIIGTLDFKHLIRLPLAVLPRVDGAGELAEVDLRVEVGGEVLAMATGIDVNDVDVGDRAFVHHVITKPRVGVDDPRVEPCA